MEEGEGGGGEVVGVLEAGEGEGAAGFRGAHEVEPNEFAAEVFRHDERDADVDGDDVGGDPAGVGVEGVGEAVAAPDFFAAGGAHGAEGVEAFAWGEGERAAGSAGDEGAVEAFGAAGGAAPIHVASGAI